MPTTSSDYITLCYDNSSDQREFVFSMKGRPFSMLSTQKLPVPSTSLIDFNLVNDLGLKMTDLQCSKFTYGGNRFRILGKISQTVQTITDGVISGAVHIKASVVEGLRSVFDSHSIAGKKMTELLDKTESSSQDLTRPGKERRVKRSNVCPCCQTSPSPRPSPADTSPPRPPSPSPGASLSPARKSKSSKPPSSPRSTEVKPTPPNVFLKPDDRHFYGRVFMKKHRNFVRVLEVDYKTNEEYSCIDTCFIPVEIHDYLKFKLGEAVLFERLDPCNDKDCEGDFVDKCCEVKLRKIYTADEEAKLLSLGVVLPEVERE